MSEHEDAAVPRAGRSFRPGDWFGIFGEHATVVLPPSEKARVAAVWALVDSGAGFDEVLDALIATGLRDLPGFVLVSEDGEDTKVVIRGAAHAEFTTAEETVTVEGSSATTWAERSLTGVRAMRIEVAAAEDGAEDLAIRDGLVRISRTDRPAVSSQATTPAPVQEEEEDRTLDPTPAPESQPERKPEPEPDPEPDPEPEPEPVIEAPGQESPLDDPPTHRHELSATEEAGWSQPAPLPQPAAAPIAAAWATPPDAEAFARHDGPTQAGNWDPGALAPAPPGIPGQPAAPGVLASPVARLTFSSGEVVDVDRAVIVGRAPEARRLTPTDEPRLVPVPSPHQEISATHLEIRPGAGADHGSAVATDLGSTNGTVLVQPGLPAEDLQPGIAVQLIPGAILDLGDGVTIQVGHA